MLQVRVYSLGLRESSLQQLGFTDVEVYPLVYPVIFRDTPLAEWYARDETDKETRRAWDE